MAQLVKADTKEIVDVPDDQVQALFQSGQYGLVPGSTLTVENKYGQTQQVKAEEASDALSSGQRIVTPPKPKPVAPKEGEPTPEEQAATKKEADLQDEFGGAGGATMAGIFGVGRGLTFGLSDLAQVEGIRALYGDEAAEDARRKLEGYKEANKVVSTGSEIAGGLAPALVTGGGSAAASVAAEGATAAREAGTLAKIGTSVLKYSPAGLTDLAAQAAEKKIGAVAAKVLLGEASENTLARLVVKGVEKGAGGAVYGALGGVGSEISEDVLGDREITGEKLAAALGHGALYGSLIGAGLGGGGSALSSGASWALEHAAPAAKKAANELAVRAISYGGLAPKSLMSRLEKLPGGTQGVGEELISKGLVRAGDSFESIAERVRPAADQAGKGLAEGMERVGAKVEGPKAADIVSTIRKEIEDRHGKVRELAGPAFKVSDDIDAILTRAADKDGRIGLTDLQSLRKQIDGEINWRDPTATHRNEALVQARSAMERSIEDTIDRAGDSLGGDALKEYKDLKLSYRRLTSAADIVEDAVTRQKKNQFASVSEKGIAGLGFVHAVASGHPLSAAAGLVGAAAHHVIAERGAATGAALLAKISDIGALGRTLSNVDQRMDRSVTSFLEGKPTEHEATIFKSAKARDEAFEGAAKRVKASVANPEKSGQALQKALGSTIEYAPKIAQKAMYVAARGAQFLASKVPPTPPSKSITPQFEQIHEYSPAEKDRFLRYVRAIDDPLSVIDDMQHGRLTKEGVESLREVYPQVYEELQKKVIEKCADAKHPLDYNQKVQLGLLLGIPTDATLEPSFMRRMQDMHAQNSGGQGSPGGGAKGPPKRPLKDFGSTAQLGTQRSDR